MFSKWDIIYISKFPETIKCSACTRHFSILSQDCTHCGISNNVTHIIAKPRPILLWINQSDWFESMSFAIPLSSSQLLNNKYNEVILLPDYTFVHSDNKYHRPMRAVIHQSTRIDGNVLNPTRLIGKITDSSKQTAIENKLLEWIFS